MPDIQVYFVQPDGSSTTVQAPEGATLKDAALEALVPGIVGSCGGVMMCGTCHVFVSEQDIGRLAPRSDDEEAVIEALELRVKVKPTSRLSCQIVASAALDGLTVYLPDSQPGI
jgi:2Fe-2S ferredoxin